MRREFSRRSQKGISLILMLVIVTLVGGIASAFFLLSQSEQTNSLLARNRQKSYYLAEAAFEQVASMIKVGYSNFKIPNNPVMMPGSPVTGTSTINGVTSSWCFQHLDPTSRTWTPQWVWAKDFKSGAWSQQPLPSDIQFANNDPTQMNLCMAGMYTIQIAPLTGNPLIDAMNSETLGFVATNYQNISGQGTGNTAVNNYFSVVVQGRIQHFDSGALVATGSRGTNVNLTREIEVSNQSLLPFFAFFQNDLEFLPGPPFVGNGKIHTNSDLYLGAGSSLDMNTDYIGATGNMYRHRKNDGSYTENAGPVTIHPPYPQGTTNVDTPFTSSVSAMNVAGLPVTGSSATWAASLESMTPNGANTSWGSQLNAAGLSPTVQQGASPMAVPTVGSIQPPPASGQPGGNFYQWASNPNTSNGSVSTGLTIIVDASGNTQAMYNNGSGQQDVTAALQSAGALTGGQIADNRQSQNSYLNTTVVDMKALRTSGYMPASGILYTADYRNGAPTVDTSSGNLLPPPTPSLASGFVFKNGADLGAPMTVVSSGPVYIQGDFNAPDTAINPATGAQFTKQYVGVIADAVNLLSNAWNNTKTPGGGEPTASNTTYNFAMITGQVPTDKSTGQYSGGLENLPRFHENWGGVTATYRGALISLWTSAIATGAWGKGNVYNPPNRNWDWDTAFGSGTAQIPGFPKAVTISRTVYMADYWGAGGNGTGYQGQ